MQEKLSLEIINNTPLIKIPHTTPELSRIYGATYIKEHRVWLAPAWYPFHDFVLNDIKIVLGDIELEEALDKHLKEQSQYKNYIDALTYKQEFVFHTKPYQHQLESFIFGLYNARCGLLLDPGLGKTKIAIDIIRYNKLYNGGGKALVIVPRVILHKWAKEVLFHGGKELKPVAIDGTPKQKLKALQTDGDIYICTYGTAASESLFPALKEFKYDTIVADESHNMRTYNSQKTKASTVLSRTAHKRIIMSGTAALGDPRHLYAQFDFLAGFLHEKNFWEYSGRYIKFLDQQRRVVLGYRNLDILNRRMGYVAVRRTKDQCLDLPDRTFVTLPYTVSKDQKKMYNDLIKSSKHELKEKLQVVEEVTPAIRLIKLTQILSGYLVRSNKDVTICDNCMFLAGCIEQKIKPYTKNCQIVKVPPESTTVHFKEDPKIEALEELTEELLLGPNNKIVIWAKYLEELNLIGKMLDKLNITHVRVDGSLSAIEMSNRVDLFTNNPNYRVYLGQIASGVGIDLTAANYTVFYSLDWDLGTYLQALDRTYRIGQIHKTVVYTFLCPGSVDEAIWNALENKDDISKALTGSEIDSQSEFVKLIAKPEVI